MTTNYHIPIVQGAPGTPATVNTPLSALDTAISGLVLAGGNVATLTNGVSSAGQKEVVVDSSTGFIASARVAYLLVGGVVEYNIIGDIHSSTQLTMTTNVGAGGIADNTYISMISESQYQLVQTVGPVALLNFATSLIPDANNTRDLGSSAKAWNNIYGNNVSASGTLTAGGAIRSNTDFNKGGTAGYLFVPLITPLAYSAWNGGTLGSFAKSLLDLSVSFPGCPAGIKAVLFELTVKDTGSAGLTECSFTLSPSAAAGVGPLVASVAGLPNGAFHNATGVVPCTATGDVYFSSVASGSNTMTIYVRIWGYYI